MSSKWQFFMLKVCGCHAQVLNRCFSVDLRRGLIPQTRNSRLLGLNVTTPPAGPAGSASDILFSEDGTKLIASVKSIAPNVGFIAIWDVARDGSLSTSFKKVDAPAGGVEPFGATVIPGKNALLVSDGASAVDVFDLSTNTATLTAIPDQTFPCWAVYSKKTGSYYLTDPASSSVAEIQVDGELKASQIKQYLLGNGTLALDDSIASIGKNE